MRILTTLLAIFVSHPALATIPKPSFEPQSATPALKVQEAFAQHGIELSNAQLVELQTVLKEEAEAKIEKVATENPADLDKSRAIYCVGYAWGAGVHAGEAGCVDIWNRNFYGLGFIGAGMQLNLEGRIFRLSVRYNSKRYAASFDPVPGDYALVTWGGTLGLGYTRYIADSGNKVVSGHGLNFILGINLGSISYIKIY